MDHREFGRWMIGLVLVCFASVFVAEQMTIWPESKLASAATVISALFTAAAAAAAWRSAATTQRQFRYQMDAARPFLEIDGISPPITLENGSTVAVISLTNKGHTRADSLQIYAKGVENLSDNPQLLFKKLVQSQKIFYTHNGTISPSISQNFPIFINENTKNTDFIFISVKYRTMGNPSEWENSALISFGQEDFSGLPVIATLFRD